MTQAYATGADFDGEPVGMARLTGPTHVELGTEMMIDWMPDIYTTRVSKPNDWIGLYRKGTCDDDSDINKDDVIHKCWLAWRWIQPGLASGRVSFTQEDYREGGEFEVRYFYGDSTGGQGYRCVTLGGVQGTYKRCLLSARATSATITVVAGSGDSAAAATPGLNEHYCDGGDGLCTW